MASDPSTPPVGPGAKELALNLSEALGAGEEAASQVLTLYVPDRDKAGRKIESRETWVRDAATLLARIGGGVTILPPAKAGWMRAENKILWERTVLIYSYVKPRSLVARLPELRALLHRFGREANQGEVVAEFDGRFYRICRFDPGEGDIHAAQTP